MPYITVESGKLTKEQKERLIEKITEVAAEIMQVPPQFFFTSIKELPEENIGIGGKTVEKTKREYFEKNR